MVMGLTKPFSQEQWPETKKRLRAWWEGEEFDAERPRSGSMPERDRAPVTYDPKRPGLEPHLEYAQAVWGEGYCGPGNPESVIELAAPLALTKEHSVAWIGLGLGGPARDVCREYGAWITGYEHRDALVAAAAEQSRMSGMAKKVTVEKFDPERFALPEQKFNAIIVRDELCLLKNREHIIAQMFQALRADGCLLLTEYVAPSNSAEEIARSCFAEIWGGAELWSLERTVQALRGNGFDLRGQVDLSEPYRSAIAQSAPAWGRLLETEFSGGKRPEVARRIGGDVEMWTRREAALKDRKLKLMRFTALRSA